MEIQTFVLLSGNLLSTVEQLSEKDKTLSDFVETALRFYIEKLKRFDGTDKDIEIINKNSDYLNRETQDALQYQFEL